MAKRIGISPTIEKIGKNRNFVRKKEKIGMLDALQYYPRQEAHLTL